MRALVAPKSNRVCCDVEHRVGALPRPRALDDVERIVGEIAREDAVGGDAEVDRRQPRLRAPPRARRAPRPRWPPLRACPDGARPRAAMTARNGSKPACSRRRRSTGSASKSIVIGRPVGAGSGAVWARGRGACAPRRAVTPATGARRTPLTARQAECRRDAVTCWATATHSPKPSGAHVVPRTCALMPALYSPPRRSVFAVQVNRCERVSTGRGVAVGVDLAASAPPPRCSRCGGAKRSTDSPRAPRGASRAGCRSWPPRPAPAGRERRARR